MILVLLPFLSACDGSDDDPTGTSESTDVKDLQQQVNVLATENAALMACIDYYRQNSTSNKAYCPPE